MIDIIKAKDIKTYDDGRVYAYTVDGYVTTLKSPQAFMEWVNDKANNLSDVVAFSGSASKNTHFNNLLHRARVTRADKTKERVNNE